MSIVYLYKTNLDLQPKNKVRVIQALTIIGLAFLFSFQSCGAGVQNNNSTQAKNNELDISDQHPEDSVSSVNVRSALSKIYSQKIAIEFVTLTNEEDTVFSIQSPIAKDLTGKNQVIVDKINAGILEYFGIPDFNEKQSYEFRWGQAKTAYEIEKEVLYMRISSSYYGGNYPDDYEDDLFFNLNSGEPIYYRQVPFVSLFTLSGYLDFINNYWLAGAKEKLNAATSCAGMEPLCSYNDITDYTIKGSKLTVSLTQSCFARVAQFCSPDYSVSVELDSIMGYLNEKGKAILSEKNNYSKNPIDKIIANQKLFDSEILKKQKQNKLYLFGQIDGKYPISMALNIDAAGQISGYYYYDERLQKLKLKGQKKDNTISMTETFNKRETGFFEIKYSSTYEADGLFIMGSNENSKYLIGNWRNPESTKSFDIKFTEEIPVFNN